MKRLPAPPMPLFSASEPGRFSRSTSRRPRIFSAADLRNLLSAANVSLETNPDVPVGVISGVAVGAGPAQGVLIDVRDFNGTPVRDVFYNGLGGVPDFVATDGTASTGAFTVFNVPEGEVFMIGTSGGLGVDHLSVYQGAISVKPLFVLPVRVAEIGITGPITNSATGLNVWPVRLSALGLQAQARFSDDRGLLQVTPLVGFRFILPSNSTFLIKAEAASFETTYQNLSSSLGDLGGAPDLSRFMEMVPQDLTNTWFADHGLTREPGTGILVGLVVGANQSQQQHNRISVTTLDGSPAGVLFQGRTTLVPAGTGNFEDTTSFVALNVPVGPVFTRISSFVDSAGFKAPLGGASVVEIFPEGVTQAEFNVGGAGIENVPIAPVIANVRGTVTLPDLVTPVTDVVIDVAGFPGGPGQYDGPIRSRTAFDGEDFQIFSQARFPVGDPYDQTESNLIINGDYIFKAGSEPGNANYVDTYQAVRIGRPTELASGALEVVTGLQVFTRTELETMAAVAGVTLDTTRGVVIGRMVDTFTGNTPVGISLKVLNEHGNEVGEVRYMDASGLPQKLDSTSLRGEFVAFNVPPGVILLHVSSENDSGSTSTRAFSGGITSVGTIPVGDAPRDLVNFAGQVADLDEFDVGGSILTFRGEPSRDETGISGFLTTPADGSGRFSTTLGVLGKFVVTVNSGADFFPTHNLDVGTGVSDVSDRRVFSVRRQRVADWVTALAAQGSSVTVDPSKGILVSDVVVRSWEDDPNTRKTLTEGVFAPTSVAAALLNGDGIADLIVANGGADQVTVYFGGEDGTFSFGGTYPVGLTPVDLLGSDVDGDGVGDILVLNQGSGDITVLRGTVRGVFREDTARRLLVGDGPIRMKLGDMDGDESRDDLVVLNRASATLSVFLRDDARRYVEASYSPLPLAGNLPSSMTVLNVDAIQSIEGRLNVATPLDDVVVSLEGSDTLETYLNAGVLLERQFPLGLQAGSRPTDVIRTDINGDGDIFVDPDLEYVVLNSGLNNVQVIELVDGLPQFLNTGVDLDPGCDPRAMRLVDTNGESARDLVILCTGTGTVAIYLGHEDGTFIPWQCALPACRRPPLVSGSAPSALTVGGFDLGAGIDLAVVNQFSDSLTLYFAANRPLEGVRVSVADLEGNPVPDVFYLDAANNPLTTGRTDTSGRFVALNVEPGNVWASAIDGDNGNRRYVIFPDEVSYGTNRVVAAAAVSEVTLQGQVTDAVGRPQKNIEVVFGGSPYRIVTQDALEVSGVYEVAVPSNQNDSMVLLREVPPAAP